MKIYKIAVPHNETFDFWEEDNMLWHIKDPKHTHPRYNTRSSKNQKAMRPWNSVDYFCKQSLYLPRITSTIVVLIDNNPKEIDVFVDYFAGSLLSYTKPLLDGGMGCNLIFAYRSFGGKIEASLFGHSSTTNKFMNWDEKEAMKAPFFKGMKE